MRPKLLIIVLLLINITTYAQKRPESYNYLRGVEAAQNENASEALDYLNRELTENPKNGYAFSWIAKVRFDMKEYGMALTAADKALKYLPKKDTEYMIFGLTTRAKVYLILKDTIKTVEDYSTAIRIAPKNTFLLYDRAQIYVEEKKYDLADADFRKIIALEPGNVLGYLGLGQIANIQKRWDDAVKQLDYAVRLNSGNSSSYALRAEAYMGLEKWDQVADDIISAITLAWDQKALSLATTIKEPGLTILLSKLKVQAAKSPNLPMWPYLSGLIYEENKQYQKAIQSYTEAIDIDVSPIGYQNIALCYLELNQFDQALDKINKSLNLDSTDFYSRMYRANIYYEMGKAELSIAEWDQLLKEEPDYAWGWYRRGWYKELSGDHEGAIEDLSMSIVLDPLYAYTYCTRGDVYLKQGKLDLAEADYKKAIELEINQDEYDCRYLAYQGLGQNDKAIEELNVAISRDSTDAGNYYDAACMYSRMHDKDNALKYLEKALEMGYHRFAHFERDTYLDFIRDSEGYKQLIKKYQALHEQENQPGVVTEEHSDMRVGEVPFVKDGGICKVKCQINGLPLHFVFDTGACDVSISLVEANFMMKNGYLSSSDVIGSQRFVDANGDISVGTVINLKSVDFGDFNLKNVRASVVRNQKAPLLLGQSVLARLGRIEIDNRYQVLRISNPKELHY